MIKKLLISICVLFSFFLMFLLGFDKINILAMGNFNNSIGTIPIQMDIDNYNKENLVYNDRELFECSNTWNAYCELNYGVSITILPGDMSEHVGYSYITKNIKNYMNDLGTYRITLFSNENKLPMRICVFGDNTDISFNCTPFDIAGVDSILLEITNENVNANKYIGVYVKTPYDTFDEVFINNFMITKGTQTYNNYIGGFEFGYNVSLSYSINSIGTVTAVNYYFNDNTYTKTTNIVDSGYLIQNYYIPFNIDFKGYISFPNINFGISSISNNNSSNTYSLQLEFTPVFSAYYKGQYTTNIYTSLSYMSNDLFFSGVTFSGCNGNNCSNTINAGNLSLTNPKTLAITEQNTTGNISTSNISTYYNEDIKNRNYFEYNNYLKVGFRIGNLAENYNFMNGRNYTFGISSLSSRIVDNNSTTTPLPDNESTTDKYNTCSAWYDIPCQLGNAVTYIIYEAPIISPVLTFIVSFITMFSSLVSFVDLFRSFGIVFGCFIIYMFINLLHKYSK